MTKYAAPPASLTCAEPVYLSTTVAARSRSAAATSTMIGRHSPPRFAGAGACAANRRFWTVVGAARPVPTGSSTSAAVPVSTSVPTA
jgi:hypothetical protein